ncbi:bifunctional DNA primase/polymerase [Streptomyces sp. NPDC041068]|uniref:bifunctional DNA primase/polymerase n=1 Tax=Streptomyces sp. NPDC041068 TaxID=3155130 RepID=UPI00341036AA
MHDQKETLPATTPGGRLTTGRQTESENNGTRDRRVITGREDAGNSDATAYAAAEYAGRGWRVLPVHWINAQNSCSCREASWMPPCPSAGKHPVESAWTKQATADLEQIARWWAEMPEANIGIATGRSSGLWVLDIDPDHGGADSLARLEAKYGRLPDTRRHRTGSGGRHYLFTIPDGLTVKSKTAALGEAYSGIDIRGEGGQIVAPPSVSGKGPYVIETDCAPLPPPAWLAGLLVSEGSATRTVNGAETASGSAASALVLDISRTDDDPYDWDTATTPGAVPVGHQDRWLADAAASARGMGLSDRAGRMMVRKVADAFTNDPRRTPWTRADADAKWAWAKANYPHGHALDDAQLSPGIKAFIENLRPDAVASERSRLSLGGGAFFTEVPETPPSIWGTGGDVLWPEGEALMITAPQGTGKTTLAHQIIRARIGLQDNVLGYPVRTGKRVLLLAMDRPAQTRRAGNRIFGKDDPAYLDEHLVIHMGPPPADLAQNPDVLTQMCQAAQADTVVVDSLKDAAVGLSEDSVGAGYNRARQKALADGIEVLELHHLTKRGPGGGSPDDLAGVYGSVWLTSGAGSVVLLWGEAGDPVVRLRHLKQPMNEIGPFDVVHDHDAGTSSRQERADLIGLASASGEEGITAHQAAGALFDTQKPTPAQKAKAVRKLDALVRAGKLLKTPGGTGAQGPATYRVSAAVRTITGKAREGVHG